MTTANTTDPEFTMPEPVTAVEAEQEQEPEPPFPGVPADEKISTLQRWKDRTNLLLAGTALGVIIGAAYTTGFTQPEPPATAEPTFQQVMNIREAERATPPVTPRPSAEIMNVTVDESGSILLVDVLSTSLHEHQYMLQIFQNPSTEDGQMGVLGEEAITLAPETFRTVEFPPAGQEFTRTDPFFINLTSTGEAGTILDQAAVSLAPNCDTANAPGRLCLALEEDNGGGTP